MSLASSTGFDTREATASPTAAKGIGAGLRSVGALLAGCIPAAGVELVLVAIALAAAGRQVSVVNGTPVMTTSGGALLWTAVACLIVLTVVVVWTAGVFAIVVAGRLLGEPVPAGRAIRLAARAWRTLTALGLLLVLVMAAAVAAGAALLGLWVALRNASRIPVALGFLALFSALLYLWRYLLAIPAAAVEGLGVGKALGRARRLSSGRATTVVVMSLAASGGASLAVLVLKAILGALLPLSWHFVADQEASVVTSWLALMVTVSVATGSYLDQGGTVYPAEGALFERTRATVSLEAVGDRLAGPPAHRRRRGAIPAAAGLLAAFLPVALFAGYPSSGLRAIPQVSNRAVMSAEPDGIDLALVGGRPVVEIGNLLIWCSDATCSTRHKLSIPGNPNGTGVAPLPGGALAVLSWRGQDLVLLRCRPDGCDRLAGAPVLGRVPPSSLTFRWGGTAIATSRQGAIAVVTAAGVQARSDKDLDLESWKLASCVSFRCSSPSVTSLLTAFPTFPESSSRLLSVTFGPNGLPRVAIYQPGPGKLALIACRSADCSRRSQATAPAPSVGEDDVQDEFTEQVSIASTTSGVPVTALPTARGASLVACRDATCTGGTTVHQVRIPGGYGAWPMLTIGRSGRPVIAGFYGGWLVLATCPNLSCADPVLQRLVDVSRPTPIGTLAIAAGQDGRPRIAWQNFFMGLYGSLHVLTCRRGCGRP